MKSLIFRNCPNDYYSYTLIEGAPHLVKRWTKHISGAYDLTIEDGIATLRFNTHKNKELAQRLLTDRRWVR